VSKTLVIISVTRKRDDIEAGPRPSSTASLAKTQIAVLHSTADVTSAEFHFLGS